MMALSNEEIRDNQWVISIKDNLEKALRDDAIRSRGKLCIYKISYYMRGKFYTSYSPKTVSLGPYHINGGSQLQSMECHKWRAVNKILERNNHGIEMFIDAMRARARGEGSCLLRRGRVEGFAKLGYERNDSVFTMRGLMHSIQCDMVLLENQLPVFVLDRLLELQPGTQNETGLVAQLAVLLFDPLIPRDEWLTRTVPQTYEADPFTDMEELHCLDIFRRSLLLMIPTLYHG
ncbi:unnamed protein product [Arabis nemorensis]|uniref:Uncharacterized protein n=1 Tax=Arabis nemorensis TaxID=586526 RepID=A0A565BUT1_9BRAS|nr:unnamed protein product [Arabis nemorensis]